MRLNHLPPAIPEGDGYRCAQVIRVLRLLRLVQTMPSLPPLEQVAQRFQVCTRTVRRDLEVLRAIGVDVQKGGAR